jgi:hypothetical protein
MRRLYAGRQYEDWGRRRRVAQVQVQEPALLYQAAE